MKRIKSAYEIALEKADKIGEEASQPERMEKRETLKPLLARYFKDKLNTEELWQKLKEEEETELYQEAQLLLIDSFGLRNTEEDFKKRKEALLAIESLKEEQNSSFLEQILARLGKVIEKYQAERESMEKRLQQEAEQNSQVNMRPVQTENGQTVMKLEPSIDKQTRQRFSKMVAQLEEKSARQFSGLIEKLKQQVQ